LKIGQHLAKIVAKNVVASWGWG